MTKTTKAYEKAVLAMCQEFIDKYEYDEVSSIELFVGRDIHSNVIFLNDEWWQLDDVYFALREDIDADTLSNWYYESMDECVAGDARINLKSWSNGLRYDRENV